MERQKATLAIENLGSKEMSLKGIGNVEEGVKKITGISIALSLIHIYNPEECAVTKS